MIPGEYKFHSSNVICNEGRRTSKVIVVNIGDRPIQVGSHYHFYEVNEALHFERDGAYGMHLNIPAGAAVRFEPGDKKNVELVDFAGERRVYGFSNKVNGHLTKDGELIEL